MLKALSAAVVVTVICWVVAGSTASSGIASLIGGQTVVAKTSLVRAVPDQPPAPPARDVASTREAKPIMASLDLPAPAESGLRRSKADFDQAFTDVTLPRRDNTPANREKLRAAGWKRVTASR